MMAAPGWNEILAVMAPLLCMVALAVVFWVALGRRDGKVPVYEIGAFYMLGVLAYGASPLIWYLLSGMEFTILSHGRLYDLYPTASQYGQVGWSYFIYQLCFVAAYLWFRRRSPAPTLTPLVVGRVTVVAIIVFFIAVRALILLVKTMFGVDFFSAYDSSLYDSFSTYTQMPLIARQLIDWTYAALLILNCALIVLLVSRWRSLAWRWVLFVWLIAACVDYALNPGSRFVLLAMFVAVLFAYDRFVHRIKLLKISASLGAVMVVFFAAGFLRGGGELLEEVSGRIDLRDGIQTFFTVSNEFQISYGSTLEVQELRKQGKLDDVPWQVYASDLLLLIPSQLLPFDKIDPVVWYVDHTENSDFFTFGVIGQSMLGLGLVEVALRGSLLGLMFALVHNWWSVRPQALWRNVFYIWLAIMSYYTVRNTSFYILTLIVLRFVPIVGIVAFLEALATMPGQARARARLAA